MMQEKMHKQNFDHEHWLKNMTDTQERALEFLSEVWETFRILLDMGVTRAIKDIKFIISKSTALDYIGGGLSALIGFFGALVLFAGVCLTGYQIVLWLVNGVWTEFPLFIVFNFMFEIPPFIPGLLIRNPCTDCKWWFHGSLKTPRCQRLSLFPDLSLRRQWPESWGWRW